MEPTSNKQKQNTRIIFQPLLLKVVANGLKSTFVLDFVGSGVPTTTESNIKWKYFLLLFVLQPLLYKGTRSS